MTSSSTSADDEARTASMRRWRAPLRDMCDRIRVAARGALFEAHGRGDLRPLARVHGQGVGDTTFALDVPTETVLSEWLESTARAEPLSLLTEDAGWRHMGPGANGRARELPDFDHGGPRIVCDPIDGTRHLMTDLRSAWTVAALCPSGPAAPRMSDVVLGIVAEIPDSRAAQARILDGELGGDARLTRIELERSRVLEERPVRVDHDARADHGYFPFFRYQAEQRPALAAIEARFFERLREHEHADPRACWDDQYISNGGQLALLTLGTYRMIADLRAFHAARARIQVATCKPYDCAGAVLVARAAGACVRAADGTELDFPLDATTPVSFVGWHNAETRARLEPHLLASY